MNNQGYRIPNMGSIQPVATSSNDNMAKILAKLNESVEAGEPAPVVTQLTCPDCGATFTYDNNTNDGTAPHCPMCDTPVGDQAYADGDVTQDPELEVNESVDQEVAQLETTLQEYVSMVDAGNFTEAKALLESVEATVIAENAGEDTEICLEKIVVKVDADGKKTKKKVRTKKVKRTAAQKSALKKARKQANKPGAKKARKKAMKARARMGLNERTIKVALAESIVQHLATAGINNIAKEDLVKVMTESFHAVNEEVAVSDNDKAVTEIENVLANYGIEVLSSNNYTESGVLVVEFVLRDTESDVYLGEICDEVSTVLNADVDYDEPEDLDEEDAQVSVIFYVMPTSETLEEKANCKKKKKVNEGGGKEIKCPKCGSDDTFPTKGGAKKSTDFSKYECEECGILFDPETGKVLKESTNESVDTTKMDMLNESFNAYAGGSDNVRCRINPSFIRAGQVIFDADQNTVFEALTESVDAGKDFASLSIDVLNSQESELAGLRGAKVELSTKGNYYLLRQNPME